MSKRMNPDEMRAPITSIVGGRFCHVWEDGTVLPIIRGGDGSGAAGDGGAGSGGGEGGSGSGDGGAGDGGEGKPDKTFTQADLDHAAGRRAAEAKRTAESELLKSLGVTDPEEAKRLITESRERDAATKTEAERAKEAAEAEKAAAAAERTAAAQERHALSVERRLVAAGVNTAKLTKAVRLIDAEVGADTETIDAEVEGLKKDWPELFATEAGDGKGRKAPSSTPSGAPARPKPDKGALQNGANRWAAKSGKTEKTDAA